MEHSLKFGVSLVIVKLALLVPILLFLWLRVP
jgi:hypothetical protein